MKTAYRIPDTPHANVKPGEKGFATVPINRMVPRSFFTNLTDGETVKPGAPLPVRGIAFGGDCGVARVELSDDGGATWRAAALGPDEGAYGFRRWSAEVAAPPVRDADASRRAAPTSRARRSRPSRTGTPAASCAT